MWESSHHSALHGPVESLVNRTTFHLDYRLIMFGDYPGSLRQRGGSHGISKYEGFFRGDRTTIYEGRELPTIQTLRLFPLSWDTDVVSQARAV